MWERIMKLVAISDTHGKYNSIQPLPKGDVLIFAGDSIGCGYAYELEDFVAWFAAHPHPNKILIAGNHDWVFEKQPDLARKIVEDAGIIYLNDEAVEIDGIKFWGSPVSPAFNNWAFNRVRGDEINQHWVKIPENTDVLITHGPPYGVLDNTPMTQGPVGCSDLRRHVFDRVKPKFHIFGHIHSAYGTIKMDDTTFINASQIDDHYRLVQKFKPVVFNIKAGV
jgi:Icc-related predicted phosphoesterase